MTTLSRNTCCHEDLGAGFPAPIVFVPSARRGYGFLTMSGNQSITLPMIGSLFITSGPNHRTDHSPDRNESLLMTRAQSDTHSASTCIPPFDAVLERAGIGITIFAADGPLISANAWARTHILGTERAGQEPPYASDAPTCEELVARFCQSAATENPDAGAFLDNIKAPEPQNMTVRVPGEGQRWLEIEYVTTDDRTKALLWRDITADHLTELQFRQALNVAADGYALWDQEDRLVFFNAQFEAFHTRPGETLTAGLSYSELYRRVAEARMFDIPLGVDHWVETRLSRHQLAASVDTLNRSDGRQFLLKEFRTAAGGCVTLIKDISLIGSQEREATYHANAFKRATSALVSTRRLSEEQSHRLAETTELLRLAQQEAIQSGEALSTLIRGLSNEVRTPLNSIIGFAEVISKELYGPLGDRRYRDYADLIQESGTNLLAIAGRLLEIAKVQSGQFDLQLANEQIGPVLECCVNTMKKRAAQRNITLRLEVKQNVSKAWMDSTAIQNALRQLIDNAIAYTSPGGEVTVSAKSKKDCLIITIEDNGIGISSYDLDRVIRPFEVAETGSEGKAERLGLGLPLAKALVELHGGTLILKSNKGKGTTVTLTLPAMASRYGDPSKKRSASPDAAKQA